MMQISGDNISPPYHHAHTRKSSSQIRMHMKAHIPIRTNHASPEENLECSPVRRSSQVEYRLHVGPPVCVVNPVVLVLPLFHPSFVLVITTRPSLLLYLCAGMISYHFDQAALDDAALPAR